MTTTRLKVLLVEDNAADARLIQESLAERSDEAFDLETVDTLEMGLNRLSAGGIDAMLLDLACRTALARRHSRGRRHERWEWRSSS